MAHITPGHNGWTYNARAILQAIDRRAWEKLHADRETERNAARTRAELEYYEENNCYPQTTGYFGTETDAHFNER